MSDNTEKTMSLFDRMNTNLITTEVKDQTVNGFFKQIKANYYLGKKAIYLVCRDLAKAEDVFGKGSETFRELVKQLKFHPKTVEKWLRIGKSKRFWKPFIEGRLPMSWTNLELLEKLNQDQFKKVESHLDPDITFKKIVEISGYSKNDVQNFFLTLLKLNIDFKKIKSRTDVNEIICSVNDALKKHNSCASIDFVNDEKVKDLLNVLFPNDQSNSKSTRSEVVDAIAA